MVVVTFVPRSSNNSSGLGLGGGRPGKNGQSNTMIIHRSASSPLLSRINEYWQTSGNRLQTLLEQRRIDDGEQAGGDSGGTPPPRRRAASRLLRDSPNRSSVTSQASQISSPPGELDRFLLVNGTLKDTSCIGDMVLSIPNKRCPNNHLDFGESLVDINDDDDTAISEVTFMTFRAELMKKALLMEYKMRKEAEWKEEQEELERAIHRAYPDDSMDESGKGDGARNNCNTTELVEMAMKIALAKMNNDGGGTGSNCKKTVARSRHQEIAPYHVRPRFPSSTTTPSLVLQPEQGQV